MVPEKCIVISGPSNCRDLNPLFKSDECHGQDISVAEVKPQNPQNVYFMSAILFQQLEQVIRFVGSLQGGAIAQQNGACFVVTRLGAYFLALPSKMKNALGWSPVFLLSAQYKPDIGVCPN